MSQPILANFCPNCGRPNNANRTVCSYCQTPFPMVARGTAKEDPHNAPQAPVVKQHAQTTQPLPDSVGMAGQIMAIGGAVLIIIAAFLPLCYAKIYSKLDLTVLSALENSGVTIVFAILALLMILYGVSAKNGAAIIVGAIGNLLVVLYLYHEMTTDDLSYVIETGSGFLVYLLGSIVSFIGGVCVESTKPKEQENSEPPKQEVNEEKEEENTGKEEEISAPPAREPSVETEIWKPQEMKR